MFLGLRIAGAVTSRATRLVSDNPRCPADGHRMRRPQYYERRNITKHTGKKVRKSEWWICYRGCGTGYPNQAVYEFWAAKEREQELDKPQTVEPAKSVIEKPVEPAAPVIEEPVEPAMARAAGPNADMKTCPWCAKPLGAAVTVCGYCKGNLA